MIKRNCHLWSILKICVIGGWVTLCLWMTAAHFDETEIKSIAGIVGAIGAYIWRESIVSANANQRTLDLENLLRESREAIHLAARSGRLPEDSVRNIDKTVGDNSK